METEARAEPFGKVPNRLNPRINWDLVPLGRESDNRIAQRLGVHPNSVRSARKTRGIPACGVRPGTKWDEQPLGQVSDGTLARRLGVSRVSVHLARRRRGIPPCAQGRGVRLSGEEVTEIRKVIQARARPEYNVEECFSCRVLGEHGVKRLLEKLGL